MSYRIVTSDRDGKIISERRGIVHYDAAVGYAQADINSGAYKVTLYDGEDTVIDVIKANWRPACGKECGDGDT